LVLEQSGSCLDGWRVIDRGVQAELVVITCHCDSCKLQEILCGANSLIQLDTTRQSARRGVLKRNSKCLLRAAEIIK